MPFANLQTNLESIELIRDPFCFHLNFGSCRCVDATAVSNYNAQEQRASLTCFFEFNRHSSSVRPSFRHELLSSMGASRQFAIGNQTLDPKKNGIGTDVLAAGWDRLTSAL